MKKLFLITLTLAAFSAQAQLYSSKEAMVTFFSKATIEDIKAENKAVTSLIKKSADEIVFKVPIRGFAFEQTLMQEHFNEKKYMWSAKHPNATFEGKLSGDYDLSKDGVYNVKAKGTLSVRGVEKEREVEGTLTVKGEDIKLNSEFYITLEEHEVPRPKAFFENIAEKVLVTLDITYKLYTPKK